MVDFAGWFIAGAITFTLCQVNFLPEIKADNDDELIQKVFEAQNVFSKIDDVKLYPVREEKNHGIKELCLLLASRFNAKGHKKDNTSDRIPTQCESGYDS